MEKLGVRINGHLYVMEVGPGKIQLSYENKRIAFFWTRPTQFKNIIWMRILNIGWMWPPVRCVGAFTDMDEPE